MDIILIGAGGHAKAVVEMLETRGDRIVGYVALERSAWLAAEYLQNLEAFDDRNVRIVMGLGGVSPEGLKKRLEILEAWSARGFVVETVIHQSAVVSTTARIETGAVVLGQCVLQPFTVVSRGAILNTGVILEHDSVVGPGAHIAPGAIVLGGAEIGRCAMIGAGAIVLPGAKVAPRTLVKAGSVFSPTMATA